MWLFFPFGFISVVHKDGDPVDVLCVRARDALSLDNLRARCPALGPNVADVGTDYPFRAYVNSRDFGAFMAAYTASIDFSNFKDQTTKQHGRDYHDACMSVWGTMHRISPQRRRLAWEAPPNDDRWGPAPTEDFPLTLFDALPPVQPKTRRKPRRR